MKSNKNTFKSGSYSLTASLIVIAIAIVIVMIFDLLPANITKLDTTQNKYFSLSEQTNVLLDNLDKDVDIYLIARSGNENSYITKLLDSYKAKSGKIKVQLKDPVIYPDFASKYTDADVSENSLIVVIDENSRYIPLDKIYTKNYSTGEDVFNGEGEITNAISLLISNTSINIYNITGHGESTIPHGLYMDIENQNYTIKDLNLNTVSAIPEDAAALIIFSPAKDITDNEFDILSKFIENKGDILLVTDYIENAQPNLEKLTLMFGLKKSNCVVFEGNSNYSLSNYKHYILPELIEHEITLPMMYEGYTLVMPFAQGIMRKATLPDGVLAGELLSSSESSYAKEDMRNLHTMEKEENDLEGPFTLSAYAQKRGASLVWISSSYPFVEEYNQRSGGINNNFFVNALSWCCDNEDAIALSPKRLSKDKLNISSKTGTYLIFLFVILIPVSVVVIAAFILIRRKRK